MVFGIDPSLGHNITPLSGASRSSDEVSSQFGTVFEDLLKEHDTKSKGVESLGDAVSTSRVSDVHTVVSPTPIAAAYKVDTDSQEAIKDASKKVNVAIRTVFGAMSTL